MFCTVQQAHPKYSETVSGIEEVLKRLKRKQKQVRVSNNFKQKQQTRPF